MARFALAAVALLAFAAACDESTSGGRDIPTVRLPSLAAPAVATRPPLGAQAWGDDNCLWAFNGTLWQADVWCRRIITSTTWDLYYRSDPTRAVRRVEFGDRNYIYWTTAGQPRIAVERQTGAVYVETPQGWLPEVEFQAWQQQEARAKQQVQARASAEAARVEAQQMIDDAKARAVDIILAPNCTESYNGCR
jgi:hypothetical protein